MSAGEYSCEYFGIISLEIMPCVKVLTLREYSEIADLPATNQALREGVAHHDVAEPEEVSFLEEPRCSILEVIERRWYVGDISGMLPLTKHAPAQVGEPVLRVLYVNPCLIVDIETILVVEERREFKSFVGDVRAETAKAFRIEASHNHRIGRIIHIGDGLAILLVV